MHERRDKNRTLHPRRNQGRPPTPIEVSARTTKRGDSSSGIPRQPRGTPSHNLPALRSSFVGREQEIEEAKSELAMTRLLTLTGVGGSGKTRLAMEVARDLVGAYPDGVWLVELAPLSQPQLVPQVVAGALGVREQPDRSLVDTLVDHLREKDLLLMLDNCEHLIEACVRLADTLLLSCPRLRILATSREALGIPGEMRWRIPPLSLPDPRPPTAVAELSS